MKKKKSVFSQNVNLYLVLLRVHDSPTHLCGRNIPLSFLPFRFAVALPYKYSSLPLSFLDDKSGRIVRINAGHHLAFHERKVVKWNSGRANRLIYYAFTVATHFLKRRFSMDNNLETELYFWSFIYHVKLCAKRYLQTSILQQKCTDKVEK